MAPRAVMVGPPGAGKSTIGRKLARVLEVQVCDTDAEIERREGRPIPQIFTTDGEAAFRALEERVVAETLATCAGVVCLGGGAILSERTRDLLAGHTVVYLDITEREGLLRTGITGRVRQSDPKRPEKRPLLAGPDPAGRYRALLKERRPLYEGAATVTVHTDRRSPGKVVREIAEKLQPIEYGGGARDAAGAGPASDPPVRSAAGSAPPRARRRSRRNPRNRHNRKGQS